MLDSEAESGGSRAVGDVKSTRAQEQGSNRLHARRRPGFHRPVCRRRTRGRAGRLAPVG
jgi:hypothetical protein